jgi:hypothetical protein
MKSFQLQDEVCLRLLAGSSGIGEMAVTTDRYR